MATSKYDALHDRFYSILTTKAGTRYERLAAIVFKKLDEEGTVIHDMELRGDSEVKHQIDVTISRNGKKNRVLIECKDYDISGSSVGLDIVRNFFAVVEDIKPNEAYIITCNDFTQDARKYAKAKNIKLVILRTVTPADLEGRIQKIVLNMIIVTITTPQVAFGIGSEKDKAKLVNDLQAAGLESGGVHQQEPMYIVNPDGRMQINEFIQSQVSVSPRSMLGPKVIDVDVSNTSIEVQHRGPIKLTGMRITFDVKHTKSVSEIGGDRIALMLIQGLGNTDMIVCDADLKKYLIDDNGEVSLIKPGFLPKPH